MFPAAAVAAAAASDVAAGGTRPQLEQAGLAAAAGQLPRRGIDGHLRSGLLRRRRLADATGGIGAAAAAQVMPSLHARG